MKKFIRLREDLHRKVKQDALDNNMTAEAVLEAIVAEWFKESARRMGDKITA